MKIYLLLLFTMAGACSYSQQSSKTFADSSFIYQGIGSGGTTANLGFYSKAVDSIRNVKKKQLSPSALDTLNFLIQQVKSKRHFQQKVGPSFYAGIYKDGRERRIAIVPNWSIIDLENKREYVFKGTAYAEIYDRFVNSNYR